MKVTWRKEGGRVMGLSSYAAGFRTRIILTDSGKLLASNSLNIFLLYRVFASVHSVIYGNIFRESS